MAQKVMGAGREGGEGGEGCSPPSPPSPPNPHATEKKSAPKSFRSLRIARAIQRTNEEEAHGRNRRRSSLGA